MKRFCCLLPWLLLAPLWGQQASGQGPASMEPAPAMEGQAQDQTADRVKDSDLNNKKKSTGKTSGTSKDRLFFTLPNFLTLENAGKVPPLTTGEKFKVTARGSFDPVELAWYGALAGVAQAENDEPQYGQGAKGYFERYGVRFADGTVENFMTKAIFPSLLREDPRYFQLGKGGVWRRAWYAGTRIFVTRTDSGHNTFNFSEIAGSATAAAISTYSYHSAQEHNLSSTLSVWATQVAFDTLSYEVKEFWPDLRRKLRHGQSAQTH